MAEKGRMGASGLACLTVAALLLAGCSPFDQIDSWPLLATQLESKSKALPGTLSALGPIVDVQWQDSTVQWGVRPLFSVRRYYHVPLDRRPQYDVPFFAPPAILSTVARRRPPVVKPGRTGLQVLALWPFYMHESCEPHSRTRFLLYFNERDGYRTDDDWYHHWGVFPLYFGGTSKKYGLYHALFPLGGTMKGKFGRDRIDFFLFPLYMHTRTDDRHSYNVLWPIVRWAGGGGRDTWYVWPLIGRSKRQDNPPEWFFLWPFFWYSETPEKGERDTTRTALFPFWGWKRKGAVSKHNVLWPLYSHENVKAKPGGMDRNDYTGVLWIFRFGSGPDYDRFQIWPLFGVLRDQHIRRQYVLWPFFQFEQRDSDRQRMRGQSLFLLYRAQSKEAEDATGAWRSEYENLLWPLWYYKRDPDDNTYFAMLNLRVVPDPQGWDRFYSFIWRIFEHESRCYGRPPVRRTWRSTRALWGAFRYDRDEDSSFLRVFPLFSSRRADSEFESFEVLAGMFGYSDTPGKRTYRVLFIPWTVDREDDG